MELKENALTPGIYTDLREKVGFQKYDISDIEQALSGSLYSVVAFNEDLPVGIARVVGDGRVAFFIKDVVVDPDYQGLNIGHKIMENILGYIKSKACPNAVIGLMSTKGKETFYESLGFIRRPTDSMGCGMVLTLNNDGIVP